MQLYKGHGRNFLDWGHLVFCDNTATRWILVSSWGDRGCGTSRLLSTLRSDPDVAVPPGAQNVVETLMKSKVSFRFARRLSRASARTLSTDGAYSCRVSRIVTDALSVRTEITLKSCAVKLNVSSTPSATCHRFRKSSGKSTLTPHSL